MKNRKAMKFLAAGLGASMVFGMSSGMSVSAADALNVGTMPLTMGIPVLYAQEQGYFEDAGLDVNVELFATGAPINEAIAANELDIAVSGFASVYSLANANCSWLAHLSTTGGMALYARADSETAQSGEVRPVAVCYQSGQH